MKAIEFAACPGAPLRDSPAWSGRCPVVRALESRQERTNTAMDAGTGDDVVSLALTLVQCAAVTVGVILWGRTG